MSVTWPARSPWWGALRWTETIRAGLATHVQVREADIQQPRVNMVMFELEVNGTAHQVVLDYADSSDVDAEIAGRVPLYFKLQHAIDGYPHSSVLPGGYIVGQSQLFTYLQRLRALRDRGSPTYDVYGRFGAYGLPIRENVLSELERQTRFRFHGSLGTVLYAESMREVAQSRVCIDLPGRGSFCYRLLDYLAVGACIVAIPHTNRLHVPLVDGEHIVYARPDGSDVADRCASLVDAEEAREAFVQRSRDFFDRYLEPRQLAAYYLASALDRLA